MGGYLAEKVDGLVKIAYRKVKAARENQLEGQGWEPSFGQGDLNERREKVSNKRKKNYFYEWSEEGGE